MSKLDLSKDDKAAIEGMKKEAEAQGFESPFTEDTVTPPAETEKKAEETKVEVKPEDKKEEKKDPPEPNDKKTRQSRAPLSEIRENIKKGLEEKYEAKLKDLETELETFRKKEEKKDAPISDEEYKAEVAKIAKELNLTEDELEKMTAPVRKVFEAKMKDFETKMQDFDTIKKERDETKLIEEQSEQFNSEFKEDALPLIKEKYPNATPEMIEKAKGELEELAFSEKYSNATLDHIFLKESKNFEKVLFSPKVKGFESDSSFEGNESENDTDIFSQPKPQTYADVIKQDKKNRAFEEGLADSRFSRK